METPLTLNNARIVRVINFSAFSKLHSRSKSTLSCYIIKTTASVVSNNAPYDIIKTTASVVSNNAPYER